MEKASYSRPTTKKMESFYGSIRFTLESNMVKDMEAILDHLSEYRSIDFSGYNSQPLEKLLNQRIEASKNQNCSEYLDYLKNDPDEPDKLISALTIQFSGFFRNPLVFYSLAEKILPRILQQKKVERETIIRAWSAGCAHGEEIYSLSILIKELSEKEASSIKPQLFATDINQTALQNAKEAIYRFESIQNVPYGLIRKYFSKENKLFQLKNKTLSPVNFAFHDLLDKVTSAPPESIFGNFDLILCRNVLIYLQPKYQNIVFQKLYMSLAIDGYLVLGEAELLPARFEKYFTHLDDLHIYQKKG